MLKRVLVVVVLLLLVAGTASAQTPKFRITGLFGFTLADGVSGDLRAIPPITGDLYDRVDPTDGGNVGFSVGFMVDPRAEVGFMFRRQVSSLEISGPTTTTKVGDFSLDGYHGYLTYYFGDPEAGVNPYLTVGLGATRANSFSFDVLGGTGTTSGNTLFSSTFGTGIQFNAARNFALKGGVSWTPTYIKSDAAGWWCDPWYGCYVVGNAQYANQFHFEGAIVFRF